MVRWARLWRWFIALAAAIAAFTVAIDLLQPWPWWGLVVSMAYGACLLFLLGKTRKMP